MGYWEDRQAEVQAAVTKKSIAQTERQIAQYYADTQRKIIGQFQQTYNKILSSIEAGKQPTPADLYKLDTYWKMQAEVAAELTKLGNKQAQILNNAFIMQYQNIYESTAIIGEAHYTQLDTKAVESMVNNIWCADGKHWSSRIWDNTARLQETLNQNLIDCLVSGRDPNSLKSLLMDSFNVSYSRADMLVRTEMAHIQIQAAEQRYTDAGVNYIEIWADKDERQCEVCGKLHKKVYKVGEKLPIPAHPNCRCSILPVVESIEDEREKVIPKQETKRERKRSIEDYHKRKSVETIETPKNKFNQEIEFESAMLTNPKWSDSVSVIKKLTGEYQTRIVKVRRNSGLFGGGEFNPASGILELGTNKPQVAIHEFGHSMAVEWSTKVGIDDYADFWKELKRIKRKYDKETAGAPDSRISIYSVSNIDEFLAEAFTLAKMKEMGLDLPKDSQGRDIYGKDASGYAEEILKLIDKYFKKKKK